MWIIHCDSKLNRKMHKWLSATIAGPNSHVPITRNKTPGLDRGTLKLHGSDVDMIHP